MIKRFLRSILLIDILKSLIFGLKVAILKKPVTVKMPREKIKRCFHTRRCFSLDHSKCIQCKICESVCPCKSIIIINEKEHKFHEKRCAYCALCEKACPKGVIKFTYTSDNHSDS